MITCHLYYLQDTESGICGVVVASDSAFSRSIFPSLRCMQKCRQWHRASIRVPFYRAFVITDILYHLQNTESDVSVVVVASESAFQSFDF
uniref:Nuclease HARBI1 n=1 Tax=Panagrellus redivivus TaxID=6233 RepID=A0A7E4VEX7_PANRE